MGTWEYMGKGKKPIVAFGPGTIPMDYITVVCANLPSDRLLHGLL